MKKYLDLDDVKTAIIEMPKTEDEKIILVKRLSRIPAADVVPVVRCRDCANTSPADSPDYLICTDYGIRVDFDFFCASGQHREPGE